MSRSSTTSSGAEVVARKARHEAIELAEVACALCGSGEREPHAEGFDYEYQTVPNAFSFVRCASCGHHYLSPRPRAEDLPVIYPDDYYAFGGTGGLVARAQRRWEGGKVRVYEELLGAGPRKLLDVGCGNGRFLALLRDFGPPEWTLVGIEFDEGAVAQCRERGFEAHVSRIEDFALENRDFDCVIMLQLLEHVEDPKLISERVFAMLRPGGIFVVETPNLAGLDFRLFRGRFWGHYHFPRHWHLFSTESLEGLLRASGFEIARSDSLISLLDHLAPQRPARAGLAMVDRPPVQLQEPAAARALRDPRQRAHARRRPHLQPAGRGKEAGRARVMVGAVDQGRERIRGLPHQAKPSDPGRDRAIESRSVTRSPA